MAFVFKTMRFVKMCAWSVEEVAVFISDEVGMPKVAANFAVNDIDGLQLVQIDDELLAALGE